MTKTLRVTTGSEVPSVPSVHVLVLVPTLLCLQIRTLLHDLGNHVHTSGTPEGQRACHNYSMTKQWVEDLPPLTPPPQCWLRENTVAISQL